MNKNHNKTKSYNFRMDITQKMKRTSIIKCACVEKLELRYAEERL